MGFPRGVVFEHGVEDDEEFSHAGGDRFFGLFAVGAKSFVEVFDSGIATDGGEGGHVEGVADVKSSAADGAGAGLLAAVVVEGCDTDEGGDLFAIELTEFGQIGKQSHRGDVAHARRRGKDVRLLFPVGMLIDEGRDVPVAEQHPP